VFDGRAIQGPKLAITWTERYNADGMSMEATEKPVIVQGLSINRRQLRSVSGFLTPGRV
jgi:hypothetical protein